MNPLELVSKTLYSFEEKELTFQLLDVFGKKAQIFSQYEEVAKIFFELKNFPKAIEYGEKAIQLACTEDEQYTTAKNLINVYNQYNYPEKALTQISKIKSQNPHDIELLLEETFSYSALNQKNKAEKLLHKLLQKKLSDDIQRKVYHNLSEHYFRKDDIHTGLQHFLKSGEIEAYKNKKIPKYEKWDGKIIKGKTIIIDSECGAGDEIIHVRFMKNLEERGMKPIWTTTRKDLQEIFNYNGFETVYIYDNPVFPKDACWIYTLALPYYLNLTIEELGQDSYLRPLPKKEKEYSHLNKNENYKIGMFWNSDSGFEQAHFRSLELHDYMSLKFPENAKLYSLQFQKDNEIISNFKYNVDTFPDKRDFTDTFSIINQMDLIITSCTSIAHIAASLGKEVCVFIPIMEYYIWTSSTGKCMWYGDNVHLFRQKKPRDWSEPIQEFQKFIQNKT